MCLRARACVCVFIYLFIYIHYIYQRIMIYPTNEFFSLFAGNKVGVSTSYSKHKCIKFHQRKVILKTWKKNYNETAEFNFFFFFVKFIKNVFALHVSFDMFFISEIDYILDSRWHWALDWRFLSTLDYYLTEYFPRITHTHTYIYIHTKFFLERCRF